MKTPIKIYLPIACDQMVLDVVLSPKEATSAILDRTPIMLNDIVSSSRKDIIVFDFGKIGKSPLFVNEVAELPEFVAMVVDRSFPTATIFKKKWFCFSVDIEYTSDKEKIENSRLARYGFKSLINQFILVTDICRLGTARFDEGLLEISEGQLEHFTPCRSERTCEVFSYIYSNGLLTISDLGVASAWIFLSENGFSRGLSNNPLARAINCLSRVYRPTGDLIEQLFWAVMGLEAVYVIGEASGKQLAGKSTVFLGIESDIEKKVKDMYNIRSRFIHGDRDLRSFFSDRVSTGDYQKSDREEYDTTLFAVGLLISTIQKMIAEQRTHLDFQFVLK